MLKGKRKDEEPNASSHGKASFAITPISHQRVPHCFSPQLWNVCMIHVWKVAPSGHGESGSSLVGLTHLFACAVVAGTGSCRRAISEMGQWKRLQQALWSRSGPFVGPIISPIRAWKSLPSQTSFACIFPTSVHGGRNSNSFFGSKPPV